MSTNGKQHGKDSVVKKRRGTFDRGLKPRKSECNIIDDDDDDFDTGSPKAAKKSKPNGQDNAEPALAVKLEGKTLKMPLGKLCDDDEYATEQAELIAAATKPVVVYLTCLLDWPGKHRQTALSFLHSLDLEIKFKLGEGKAVQDNLFKAVLESMVGSEDLDRFSAGKAAALEVAALMHPNELEAACDQIVNQVHKLKVKGIRLEKLVREAQKIVQILESEAPNVEHDGETEAQQVIEVWPDAPVAQDVVVPDGWRLDDEGIWSGDDLLIPATVLITRRHQDINEGIELVTLAWRREGEWKERKVARSVIADARMIVNGLADYGVPVNSINAKDLICYLADFENVNLDKLPAVKVSRQLGWQGERGEDGFLWGTELIQTQSSDHDLQFLGSDEGDEQFAAGFHARGTMGKWKKAIEKIEDFPRARLALYISFVPPILSILDSPNFVAGFCGETSSGKTATLRVAASVWGNPDEKRNLPAVLRSWDMTQVWRERASTVLNGLPFLLDDTKLAHQAKDVATTIYGVAGGVGRGRGTVKGLARQESCRTVLLTSGEQTLTSHTQDGGTRPRVVSLWGSPFEQTNTATGQKVRSLTTQVGRNYGHAGPEFIRFLIENREMWPEWRKEYRKEIRKFEEWADGAGNTLAVRMATTFAIIAMAAWLVDAADILSWEYEDPVEPLWEEIVAEVAAASPAVVALRYVMDWAHAHQEDFFGREKRTNHTPHGGWAGRWDQKMTGTPKGGWNWIGFIPSKLNSLLQDGGFEPESTTRIWKGKGWLKTNPGRKTYKARVGTEKRLINMIAIKRGAIEEAENE